MVNIQEGQPVTVVLDAIPDVTLKGEVQSISQTFAEKQGDVVYEVTVRLNDTHPDILWGMTAVVKFAPTQDWQGKFLWPLQSWITKMISGLMVMHR